MQRFKDATVRGRVTPCLLPLCLLASFPRLEFEAGLTFVAVGALLRVKIFWCHPKHVITLNAHAVQDRLSFRRGFMLRRMTLLAVRFWAHSEILAQEH
jgi:hypothetical protein